MESLSNTIRVLLFVLLAGLLCGTGQAVDITVDQSAEYQTIDGFGAHGSMEVWWGAPPFYDANFLTLIVDDLGMTINRNEYYPKPNEPGQWPKQIPWLQALKAKADSKGEPIKFITAYWTPPYDFKDPPGCCGGRLRTDCRDDLGDYSVQAIQDYKDIGIDLYAMSLQNEPNFSEPYNSCVYNREEYRDMLKVAGPIIHSSWPNVKLYGVEHMLWPQQWDSTSYEYAIINDPCANPQMGIWAVHGYGSSGTTPVPGSDEVTQWTAAWNRFSSTARPLWMTETSGYEETWAGARQLAQSIYAALKYGHVSAWVWWQLGSSGAPNAYELTNNGIPTKRYFTSKHYYRYIRPGAKMVSVASSDPNVLVTAFKHPTQNTATIVLINTRSTSVTINLAITGYIQPDQFDIYRTSATENCVNVGTVAPNGSFTMPASCVVTLYGEGIFPTPATNPWPQVNAQQVSINTNLYWTSGLNTTSHDIYLGTSNPPPFRTNVRTTTYDPGSLTKSKTYFWRIDEKNDANITTQGTVWRFMTGTDEGDGLLGLYYDNNDLINRKLTLIDHDVNFTWGASSPDPAVEPDTFSARWLGLVQPRYSETYTFYTNTNDGVRLWVDGNMIIDKWLDQNTTEWNGTVVLAVNEKYDIEMQYYENTGDAVAQLKWSSPSQTKQIVPQGRLFTVFPLGDLNRDYYIDLADLGLFTDQWLTDPAVDPNSVDFDDSNSVDFYDFALFGHNWGL